MKKIREYIEVGFLKTLSYEKINDMMNQLINIINELQKYKTMWEELKEFERSQIFDRALNDYDLGAIEGHEKTLQKMQDLENENRI